VNEYLGPLIDRALQELVKGGFLRVTYGGATEGAYLCNHAWVDEIHMTGSDKSYEAITFGVGAEGERRKQERRPIMTKPFTAELGNVGPAIVVPGDWSAADVRYQAEQLVSHLCDSNSYSCSRARVLIQNSNWRLRGALLDEIRKILRRLPTHPDYYPGASSLFQRFIEAHPGAELFGSREGGYLPWGIIPDIPSTEPNEMAFTTESFCPILAETSIDASSTAEYIDRAVEFANERLWGTLAASIVVHPRSLRDPETAKAVERAISGLRYGIVSINCLPGMNWLLTSTPWGSYPGNPSWNIQSGVGFVNNASMFSRPQKTVVRSVFRTTPWPIWFPSRVQTLAPVVKLVTAYERHPSWRGLLSIVKAGLG
jgi:acyl-CoA reductase-like NAD-dependent aldehyde dehydrogenase